MSRQSGNEVQFLAAYPIRSLAKALLDMRVVAAYSLRSQPSALLVERVALLFSRERVQKPCIEERCVLLLCKIANHPCMESPRKFSQSYCAGSSNRGHHTA